MALFGGNVAFVFFNPLKSLLFMSCMFALHTQTYLSKLNIFIDFEPDHRFLPE